ncbi:hypothetical protein WN943_029698 [Citrus x changshan-huyou]
MAGIPLINPKAAPVIDLINSPATLELPPDLTRLLLLVYLRNILLIRTFSNLSPCETVPAEQNSPQATMDAAVPSVPDLCSFLNAFLAA